MSQQSPPQANPTVVQVPSNDALQAAINRHVAKAAETVACIPPQLRTILSKSEAQTRSASTRVLGKT